MNLRLRLNLSKALVEDSINIMESRLLVQLAAKSIPHRPIRKLGLGRGRAASFGLPVEIRIDASSDNDYHGSISCTSKKLLRSHSPNDVFQVTTCPITAKNGFAGFSALFHKPWESGAASTRCTKLFPVVHIKRYSKLS